MNKNEETKTFPKAVYVHPNCTMPPNLSETLDPKFATSRPFPKAVILHEPQPNKFDSNSPEPQETATASNYTPKTMPSSDFALQLFSAHHFIKIHSVLHIYLGSYYIPLTTGKGDQIIRLVCPVSLRKYLNANFIKETIAWLDTIVTNQASEQQLHFASLHLNFLDGYYDVVNDKLHPHSHNMIFTSVLPFSYEECARSARPADFEPWLNRVTKESANLKMLLIQVMGYFLCENRSAKSMFILYGASNTGKSVFLNLLKTALGPDFVKSISLHNITANFRTAELVGAKANIFAELDHRKLTNVDMVKALIGGIDQVNADVKNGKPIEFINKAALLFSTNTLDCLRIADPGHALANRLLIIPFNEIVPPSEIDPQLLLRLVKELPAIIYHYVIPGLYYLIKDNFRFCLNATAQFKDPQQEKLLHAITFLKSFCSFECQQKEHTDTLYDAYIHYANHNRVAALTKLEFRKLLCNLHQHIEDIAPLTHCEKFRKNGFNKNGFLGIELRF